MPGPLCVLRLPSHSVSSPFIASILNPETLINKGGLALVMAIIFAETGLLIGFFLPGDSLLFISGYLSGRTTGAHLPSLGIVVPALIVCAFIGNEVGYQIGKRIGPALFNRADSRLFRQANVAKAQEFFDRHGSKALVLARFVPIVRTFIPILAGVGLMDRKRFTSANAIGAVLWAGGVTVLGYFLGKVSWIKNNIEIALLLMVAISLVPVALEFMKHRRSTTRA
jgi:membrane-associated protein